MNKKREKNSWFFPLKNAKKSGEKNKKFKKQTKNDYFRFIHTRKRMPTISSLEASRFTFSRSQ